MKKLLLLAIVTFFSIGFASKASAQISASNTAAAKIITVIGITPGNNLEFGSLSVVNATGGDFIVGADNTFTVPVGLNRSLFGNTARPASFNVSGEKEYTYSILLPLTIPLEYKVGEDVAATMTVKDIKAKTVTTTTPAHIATGKLSADNGTETFTVGGTLTVNGTQAVGTYSGTFNVTVAYN